MRPELRTTLWLALALGLSACAPRLYQRETLSLDHREIERFDIRYAEFEGCLLRRPVPVAYRLERPSYTLSLDVLFGEDARAPAIDLGLSRGEDLSAQFPDLATPPTGQLEGGSAHYRIDSGTIHGSSFTVRILTHGRPAGEEIILVEHQHCRALALDRNG